MTQKWPFLNRKLICFEPQLLPAPVAPAPESNADKAKDIAKDVGNVVQTIGKGIGATIEEEKKVLRNIFKN